MTTTARRGLLAAALALILLVLPASTAVAQISGVWGMVTDRNPDNIIPASFPNHDEARNCVYEDCEHYEDVFFVNVDISDQMVDYESYAQFYVVNAFVSQTTYWFVCSYDAEGAPLDCFFDSDRSWGLMAELSSEARELRLFPIQSPATEYSLKLYVE